MERVLDWREHGGADCMLIYMSGCSIFFLLWFQCTEVLLEKFREKKATVVQSLKEAIDAVFLTVAKHC